MPATSAVSSPSTAWTRTRPRKSPSTWPTTCRCRHTRAAAEGVTTMTDTDLLILRDGDNVGVLTSDRPGIARGHKVALVDIEPGTQIRKYGQSIGVASVRIGAGSHVHTHNVRMDDTERVSELGGAHHEQPAPAGERPTFLGYRRANGRVGTRNYIGIVTSVNCSASTARMIAAQFPPSVLAPYE